MTEAFGITDTGCIRSNNEDCYRIVPELGLYLLADGMGGAKAGERASELAVDSVAQVFRESDRRDSQVLLKAIETANRKVIDLAKNDLNLEGMGTTLVAALDLGEELLIASVGDSRAYLLENGAFRAITEDQSWVNEVGRPLGLDEAALRTHPIPTSSANLIVNCYTIRWKLGSMALLSSDGLHGVLRADVLESIVRADQALNVKCRRFIEAARSAGAPDNVTAVLLRRVQ